MRKPRLMTPGPAMVPEDVLLELARPVIHHRSAEAKQVITEVVAGLKEVFQTRNDVLILTASGTGAMEAAVVNTVPPGGKALVLNAGHFAARWGEHLQGLRHPRGPARHRVGSARRSRAGGQRAEAAPRHRLRLRDPERDVDGTGHPVEAIGRVVAETPAVFAVDGISGVGAMECRTDAWNIDLLCVGSQKALMLPPGLAFVAVSPKAWAKIDAFDVAQLLLQPEGRPQEDQGVRHPVHPGAHADPRAPDRAAADHRTRGSRTSGQRHRRMSEACQAGVQALGLELFSSRPAEGLTVFRVPEGLKDTRHPQQARRAVRHDHRRRPG